MKKLIIFLVVLILTSTGTALLAPKIFPRQFVVSAQEWGFMMGNVYDLSGNPIEKATVSFIGNTYQGEKKTNAYGSWSFAVAQQGYYTITISKPRYITQTFTVYAGSSASYTQTFLQPQK